MSSFTISTINKTTDASSSLSDAFSSYATSSIEQKLKTGITWNGDTNYSSLGIDFESRLLELDQKMVTSQQCLKDASLDRPTIDLFDKMFDTVIDSFQSKSDQERAKGFNLMFRYMFYVRSVRAPGKKSRLLFYYLFERMYLIFPDTCINLLSIIPDFGYFGDIDQIIGKMNKYPHLIKNAMNIYMEHLNNDCMSIWHKNLNKVTKVDAVELNGRLKKMTTVEIRQFISGKHLSLSAKWFKREAANNSKHRKDFLVSVYFPNGGITDLEASIDPKSRDLAKRRITFCQMVFRNVISALSQCLLVGETMMCEENPTHRTWGDIPITAAPATFVTKYRKALVNECIGTPMPEHLSETGNRHITDDRIKCRKNMLQAITDTKLKGASQDIDRLCHIIYYHICCLYKTHQYIPKGYTRLSPSERLVIAAQWNCLVAKIKKDIDDINQSEQSTHSDKPDQTNEWIDPRNVIPVIDTSGSMHTAEVQDIAIGLGIIAASISGIKGCLISFSSKPEVFHLDMSGKSDVFDHFKAIMDGPTGLNTNIDATYTVLLDMMVRTNVKTHNMSLLYLTDGQFDTLVRNPGHQCLMRGSGPYPQTYIDRLNTAFHSKGYNTPRTVFWNLNCLSPGFPASSNTQGIQLVSGYSQSLMTQVFTGAYKYEKHAGETITNSVSPWESFNKALFNSDYDRVSQIVTTVGEGCLKYL